MPPMRSAGTVSGTPYTAEAQLNDLIYGPSDYEAPLAYDPSLDTQGMQQESAPPKQGATLPAVAPTAAPAAAPTAAPYGPPADQGYQAQTQTAPTSAPAPVTSESYVTNAPQDAPQPAPGSSYNMVDAARAVSPAAPTPAPPPTPGPGSSYNMVTAAQSVSPPMRGGGSPTNGVSPVAMQAPSGVAPTPEEYGNAIIRQDTLGNRHLNRYDLNQRRRYDQYSGGNEAHLPVQGNPPLDATYGSRPAERPPTPLTRPGPSPWVPDYRNAGALPGDDPLLASISQDRQQQTDQQRLDDLLNTPAEGDAAFFDNLGSTLGTMRDNLGRTSGTYQAAQMLPDVGRLADWARPPGGLGPSQAVRDVLDWANPPGGLGPSQAVRDTVGTIAANGAAGLGAISDLMPFQPAQPEPFGTTQQFRNASAAREQAGTNAISGYPDWMDPQTKTARTVEPAQNQTATAPGAPMFMLDVTEDGTLDLAPISQGDIDLGVRSGMQSLGIINPENGMYTDVLANNDHIAAAEGYGMGRAALDNEEFDALVAAGVFPVDAEGWRKKLVGNVTLVPNDWAPYIKPAPQTPLTFGERAGKAWFDWGGAGMANNAGPGETQSDAGTATDVGVGTTPTGDVVFTPVAGTAATPSGGVASDVYGGGGSGSGSSSGGGYRTSYGGGDGGSDGGYAPSAMPPGFMEGFRWRDMLPEMGNSASSRSSSSRRMRRGRGTRMGRNGRSASTNSAPSSLSFAGVPRNPAEEMNLQRLIDLQGRR